MRVFQLGLILAAGFALAAPPSIAVAQSNSKSVEVPFLWSQSEAEEKCTRIAAEERGRWTGQWRMNVPGQSSFCEIADIRPAASRDVEAGPIWNQADAEAKCPRVAADARGRWNGQWRTTVQGRMSVCGVEDLAIRARDVEAGPIWSQQDADVKCPVVAYAVRGRWTGQWRTTVQGQMSVCEIADRN